MIERELTNHFELMVTSDIDIGWVRTGLPFTSLEEAQHAARQIAPQYLAVMIMQARIIVTDQEPVP